MTVQFNYWVNDKFRKITLEEGDSLGFGTGGETEEGYNYTSYAFVHEGDQIRLEVSSTGRDCDGRLDTYQEFICPIDKLDKYATPDGTLTPDWDKVDESQRDYSAEAMNY